MCKGVCGWRSKGRRSRLLGEPWIKINPSSGFSCPMILSLRSREGGRIFWLKVIVTLIKIIIFNAFVGNELEKSGKSINSIELIYPLDYYPLSTFENFNQFLVTTRYTLISFSFAGKTSCEIFSRISLLFSANLLDNLQNVNTYTKCQELVSKFVLQKYFIVSSSIKREIFFFFSKYSHSIKFIIQFIL